VSARVPTFADTTDRHIADTLQRMVHTIITKKLGKAISPSVQRMKLSADAFALKK
jgi:hypothetical protein